MAGIDRPPPRPDSLLLLLNQWESGARASRTLALTDSSPKQLGPSCTITLPRALDFSNHNSSSRFQAPPPWAAPRSFSAGVTFALQTFRPALCLPCCFRPRPMIRPTNNRKFLEPLGGPSANAHAVGGPLAGIGGEATALCPHSGLRELRGPWGGSRS